MGYKVIHYFEDMQDRNHPYNEGDIFPRDGYSVSEERIKELLSDRNRQHKPLIVFAENEPQKENKEIQYTKTIINIMPTTELQELAISKGVDNANKKTGSELKKILIELLQL